MNFDLDKLEEIAVKAYCDLYGEPNEADLEERYFVQRGIEAMRYAVAHYIEEEMY